MSGLRHCLAETCIGGRRPRFLLRYLPAISPACARPSKIKHVAAKVKSQALVKDLPSVAARLQYHGSVISDRVGSDGLHI